MRSKINPDELYWLYEIHRKRFIPKIKSYVTLRKFVETGKLKAFIYGKGKAKRYMIKGKNLISFLKEMES